MTPTRNFTFISIFLLLSLAAHARTNGVSTQALNQISALQKEKHSWTPTQRKINSHLLFKMKHHLNRAMVSGVPKMRSSIEVDQQGFILADIDADVSDSLLNYIEALGGKIINHHARYNAIRAKLPLSQIENLAALDSVHRIRPADRAMTRKTNTSEGVVAHKADVARSAFTVDGTGVKVGVLSDSVDHLSAVQASGDLPNVTVLEDEPGNTGEGTAMLEIVHDMAPGAQLYFATGFGSEASFAQNILDLQAAGCDVIVDDIFYFAEPVFQDGIIAQAIEDVVAAGAVYFSSAGNSGNKNDGTSGVWEGDFNPIPAPSAVRGTAHNFGGGKNYNTITVDPRHRITLKWTDPWGGSGNDYDLYLLNATRTAVIDSSNDSQEGSDYPYEFIDSHDRDDVGNTLVVVKDSGENRFIHLNTHRGELQTSTSGQSGGHNSAIAAFSVAAVSALNRTTPFTTSNKIETFSSDGLRRVFFEADGTPITPGNFSSTGGEVRSKPDITAADGVKCATQGFAPFYGTSAAAPHAAGIAALIIENGLTLPSQIRQAMTSSTWDIEAAGFDRDSGFGIVDASRALAFMTENPVSDSTIAVVGNMVYINLTGKALQPFKLQATDNLVFPDWQDKAAITFDRFGNAIFNETLPIANTQFYRTTLP